MTNKNKYFNYHKIKHFGQDYKYFDYRLLKKKSIDNAKYNCKNLFRSRYHNFQ